MWDYIEFVAVTILVICLLLVLGAIVLYVLSKIIDHIEDKLRRIE